MHAEAAVAGLGIRQIRTATAVVIAVVFGMAASAAGAYSSVTALGTGAFAELARSPALRAIYGPAQGLDSAGGFSVWRMQTFVTAIAAIWMILATTRLLRGDEELGRWELVLAHPISRRGSTAATLAVLLVACVLCGLAWAMGQTVVGAGGAGAWLYGVGFALMMACFASVAAVAAQVVPTRRRASGIALGVYGVALLLRMLGNASSDYSWLTWLTPLGWQTKLQAFAGNNPAPLIPLALTPIVLGALALFLSVRRDTGAGLFLISDQAEPKTALLSSPESFALRRRIRDFIPWAVAVAISGVGFGGLSGIFSTFIADDASWRDLIQQYNMGAIVTVPGFVAVLASFSSLVIVAYGITVIRIDYDDETIGRLDIPYSNAVSRGQWNWSLMSTMLIAVLCLVMVSATSLWLGATWGGGGVTLIQCVQAAANYLPISLTFLGIAWLIHGLRPAVTTVVVGGLVGVAYLVAFLGAIVKLPTRVIDLSPYTHLTYAPAEPAAWNVLIGCLLVAIVGLVGGFLAYERRDLGV